jgi:hypothetical protein
MTCSDSGPERKIDTFTIPVLGTRAKLVVVGGLILILLASFGSVLSHRHPLSNASTVLESVFSLGSADDPPGSAN